jgi:hypothetical protein
LNDSIEGAGKNVRSLTDAIRRVRTAEAERSDVVVELRDAEKARLEMLADELRSVFSEVPSDNDTFLFTVAGGTPPRLWIDMTAFVALGRDRRTYRFLKDTRVGRTVILETADVGDMADCVTNYVAERIIERERAMEGDWLLDRIRRETPKRNKKRESATEQVPAPAAAPAPATTLRENLSLGWVAAAFLLGILIGAVVLFGWAWVRVG